MTKLKNRIVRAASAVKEALTSLWRKEPARVVSATAAVAVFFAAKFGVVLSAQDILPAITTALPVLLGGEVIRANVTPVS